MAVRFFDIDWRRVSRWCCLLSIAMVIWLFVPTIKCSVNAFRDTPLGEVDSQNVADADKDRVEQGTGFWSRWGTSIKGCYREKTPLARTTKRDVLCGLVGMMVVAWALDRVEKRRKRTFTS